MFQFKKILCTAFILSLILSICSAAYAEEFIIHKIRITGLQRISQGAVLSKLPVREGDRIDSSQTVYIIRDLYDTNFFSDVNLTRSNNDLLIKVVERPVIGTLKVSGNSKITTKQINEVLKSVGLVEGRALDQALLNRLTQALMQQYYNLGLYDAKIDTSIKPLERNRVAVSVNIKEGPASKIKSIKIIGNKIASESKLLGEFSLSTTKLWSFFTNSDQYSKEKLDADLEKLRYYYMDRGYLKFNVDAVKVRITPDKKYIYITINITEGPQYKIKGFSVEGNLIGKRAAILKLITIKPGNVFSRKDIIDIQSNIQRFLGDYGYGMARIMIDPMPDDANKQMFIKFIVDPGQRIYIHRINFVGNNKTNDEVLRREMRLQEGSMFSLSKIETSKRLLANLGYLDNIEYKITPVPEDPNLVDLTYEVKEVSAVTAALNVGYSDVEQFLYGASISDSNIFGTGKTASIKFDNGRATQNYGIGYSDPYFTINHIGLGIDGYYQKTNTGEMLGRRSAYSIDTFGGITSFFIPLSDDDSVTFGVGVEHIKLKAEWDTRPQVVSFLKKYGSSYNQAKIVVDWRHSNFDRAIFPTKGFSQGLNFTLYAPLNNKSLEFYTVGHTTSWYLPLFSGFIFHTITTIDYGNGFGKNKELPFFRNFFGGGIGSVRGFEAGDLGIGDPDCIDIYGNATGGNLLTVASANIIIPFPMKDIVRPSVFIDTGDVYNNRKFKIGDFRVSAGVQLEVRTPLAPLIFSLAKPIRKKSGDRLPSGGFQFSLSASI